VAEPSTRAGGEPAAAGAGAFDRDTAVRPLEASADGRASFAAEISPAWHAARGPHGGYLAALMLRALVEGAGEQERAPRSLTVHYARPPRPGPVTIETTLERRGRSLSTCSARMQQDGHLVALALAAFSVPWSAPEVAELPLPSVAAPDAARRTPQVLRERIERGLAPRFLGELVIQPRIGPLPFAGSGAAMEVGSWLGLADASRPLDAIALAMLCDVGVPPPFVRLTEPAVASTVDLTVHFRTRLPRAGQRDPAELCFARLRSRLVHEGFFESDGVIWAADGVVLAQARQLAILMELARE
jgi:acyl-CoA thioesterase